MLTERNPGRPILWLLIAGLLLTGLLIASSATAQSWLEEGARKFEELRLRQLQSVQAKGEIRPFTSDGCSGKQSEGWEMLARTMPGFKEHYGTKPPWESCCLTHDRVYWQGKAVDGYARRMQADQELRQCVVDTGVRLAPELSQKYSVPEDSVRQAFLITAELMYLAVRVGGQPCSLLPWRWGYGWDNCAFERIDDMPEIHSDIKLDENVIFFNTAGWLDDDNRYWHLPIHAWVYQPQDSVIRKKLGAALLAKKYNLKVTPENEGNFRERVNLLIADNERGKKIVIRIAGQDIELPETSANGHTVEILKLPVDVVSAFSVQSRLHYFAVTDLNDTRRFEGDVQLVAPVGVSVISDIDDTVKITQVGDRKRLFENTFYRNFREVEGMSPLYRQLAAQNIAFHFVSSSPWQLYGPLQEFLGKAGFPPATLNLKSVRFRDKSLFDLFKKGTETKPKQIDQILRRFPRRQFILIGDNGEQDPEVYGDFARRYPSQIQRILIRNTNGDRPENERYQQAFSNIPLDNWQLFSNTEEITTDALTGGSENPPGKSEDATSL